MEAGPSYDEPRRSEVTSVGYWHNGHMDSGWGFVMVLVMVGIWALVAIGIVWLVRSVITPGAQPPAPTTSPSPGSPTGGAEQILAERLARGEIDNAEYQTRLDALRSRS